MYKIMLLYFCWTFFNYLYYENSATKRLLRAYHAYLEPVSQHTLWRRPIIPVLSVPTGGYQMQVMGIGLRSNNCQNIYFHDKLRLADDVCV